MEELSPNPLLLVGSEVAILVACEVRALDRVAAIEGRFVRLASGHEYTLLEGSGIGEAPGVIVTATDEHRRALQQA